MPSVSENKTSRELVVLIHGLGSSRWVLWPLAQRLARRGYATRLWTYLSIIGSTAEKGQAFAKHLDQLASSGKWDRIHVVAHSMGSIVTRCAIGEASPELQSCLGRVVLIGPPNGGSHIATKLQWLYGWFCEPVNELSDRPESFVNNLPPPPAEIEVGILAASHDNVIHLEKTHLPGQRDHRVVTGWHVGILMKRETAELVASFLRVGKFASFDAA